MVSQRLRVGSQATQGLARAGLPVVLHRMRRRRPAKRQESSMAQATCPDVTVYICCNCVPTGRHLPRQWTQDGAHVLVREVPCSGKLDAQYLLHGFEGGVRGLCVVACPKGDCHLAQGNYRAEIRVRTAQRMLAEIGLEPQRVELLHVSPDDPEEQLVQQVREAAQRICAYGANPIAAKRQESEDRV
jgi:F420-non-reducing hydrogenase iron-sulfur subunit